MASRVRIIFTGVSMFIVNEDTSKQVKACVIMPDAEGTGDKQVLLSKKAPDGTFLRRHRAFVRFNLLQLERIANKTDLPVDAEGLWYVEGKRIAFKFTEAGVANPFRIDPALPNNLLSMPEIAGSYADKFPDVVSPTPPPKTLASQVLVNKGLLKNEIPIADLSTWVVPPTLNGTMPPVRKILTHLVTLELLDISAVEIVATPLTGGTPEIVKLQTIGTEDVNITISHLCHENPLRWLAKDAPINDDEDFKWHYMLLSPTVRTQLETSVLQGLPLPIPLRPLNVGTAGQGVNCPPSIGLSRPFDLDMFLPA